MFCLLPWPQRVSDRGSRPRRVQKKQFIEDVLGGHGGFKVTFAGTAVEKHINWKWLVNSPSAVMFFGPPRDVNRSFDEIFKDVSSTAKLHQRFLAYYDEFEGDVTACLSLYNSYLTSCLNVTSARHRKELAERKTYDPNIFWTKKVIEFLESFDLKCKECIEYSISNFVIHSHPIIITGIHRQMSRCVWGHVGIHETIKGCARELC